MNAGFRRRWLAAAAPLALALATGCANDGTDAGIDRAAFVSTYIDLREAAGSDTLDATTRDSILSAHDVTEAELRAYVAAHTHDPEALSETWREVMDSVAARDSVASEAAASDSTAVNDTL